MRRSIGSFPFVLLLVVLEIVPSETFSLQSRNRIAPREARHIWVSRLQPQRFTRHNSNVGNGSDEDEMDDDTLQNLVTLEQLVNLCRQCRISEEGTKHELLKRLRDHAEAEAEAARQRMLARVSRVQNGVDDSKERFEIVSDDPDDPDDADAYNEGFFYFELPRVANETNTNSPKDSLGAELSQGKEPPRITSLSRDAVTSPPPPLEANALGERVVTTYSTTESNDLTGIAAAQPGRGSSTLDALSSGGSGGSSGLAPQPWDLQNQHSSETSAVQIEHATEKVTELVALLLAMTGAPGFVSFDDDEADDNVEVSEASRLRAKPQTGAFDGFNPANIPPDLLTSSSRVLRTDRGQVLSEVLRRFELQAIGYDGMAGDNTARGGGHYREVAKIRAFLEGFRKAEVRRLARETTSLLIDKLVLEGLEGLDMTLSTMVRSGDDTDDFAGSLNDSLLDFLNDSIRQQEKKVEEMRTTRRTDELNQRVEEPDSDTVESLWQVTTQNGQRLETLDPNDPHVKKVLLDEEFKETASFLQVNPMDTTIIPEAASEQILMLLKLLRERVKTEAAFAPDEKGRNLRLLAYCLRVSFDDEKTQLMQKYLGNSLDRMDSFIELVASSIEYGESTSYQLQPAKKQVLNLPRLNRILELSTSLRQRQRTDSSTLRP